MICGLQPCFILDSTQRLSRGLLSLALQWDLLFLSVASLWADHARQKRPNLLRPSSLLIVLGDLLRRAAICLWLIPFSFKRDISSLWLNDNWLYLEVGDVLSVFTSRCSSFFSLNTLILDDSPAYRKPEVDDRLQASFFPCRLMCCTSLLNSGWTNDILTEAGFPHEVSPSIIRVPGSSVPAGTPPSTPDFPKNNDRDVKINILTIRF